MRPECYDVDARLAQSLLASLTRCDEAVCRQRTRVEQLTAAGRCDAVHLQTLAEMEFTYALLYGLWKRASLPPALRGAQHWTSFSSRVGGPAYSSAYLAESPANPLFGRPSGQAT